ncbi:putative metallo-hydrolase YqgX [Geobacter sp. OR-1]|uniref:MBL fold metallo-hydrolase n=1 Tax=Geobacter sp. OR-1 TaxID=1266765 RepID=UPI0005420F3D|nr:MBL fold metallo-hydrolase [Geobacter sp. OR-1]GAM08593.1 putative metallo-hydrolase YqgX [Geobacter sp. OR-1]
MQISSRIHAIRIPFTVPTPLGPIERFVYAYLVCGEQVTLFDSGVAGADELIFAYLDSIGRGREISRLLLTHSHPDHIGAARAIRAATGCAVLAGSAERSWIEDTGRQERERPVPGFSALVGGPVQVDRVIADGETMELGGGLLLEVIATPGHSAGSLSFFLRSEGALFSGDAVPVPGDLPIYDDYRTSVATLERLQGLQGVELLLEAWQEPRAAIPSSRLAEGLAWLQAVDTAIRQAGGEEQDAMALCRQVVTKLGLSPLAVNPLVARSFCSHKN